MGSSCMCLCGIVQRGSMKHLKIVLFSLIALILVPVVSFGWQGKVVGVSDGDTITVMHDARWERREN